MLALVAIILIKPIAIKIGLTDKPCTRKRHQGIIPLIGGIAIFISAGIVLGMLNPNHGSFILAASLVVMTGIIDDYKGISVKYRFLAEGIAAYIMAHWCGVEITSLGNLLGTGEIQLGALALPFTIFAIIGGINAFNMLDGIDGLAGTLAFSIFCLILLLGSPQQLGDIQLYCYTFMGAICAFLLFNLRILGRTKATVFLGDCGSTLFGFTICWLIINASQGEHRITQPVTVLWLIAVPLFDTLSIMIRRIYKGTSPFAADREHFHHILPVAGYSINQTVAIIVLSSVLFAVFGILAEQILRIPEWLSFALFIALFGLYMWAINHAWTIMKIARYLREKNTPCRRTEVDRRKNNNIAFIDSQKDRRWHIERRSDKDRRYYAAIQALDKKKNMRKYSKISFSALLKKIKQ